jgi:hypothetical protein
MTLEDCLARLAPGPLADTTLIERLLARCWEDLRQPYDAGMEAYKLLGRMENVHWQPPILRGFAPFSADILSARKRRSTADSQQDGPFAPLRGKTLRGSPFEFTARSRADGAIQLPVIDDLSRVNPRRREPMSGNSSRRQPPPSRRQAKSTQQERSGQPQSRKLTRADFQAALKRGSRKKTQEDASG